MKDDKKPDGVIPKIPQRNIMQNDVDRTIGLRDSEMMKLVDAILAKEVSIKGNKLPGAQQREGVTLHEWCQTRKQMRIVKNELMAEFKREDLPSKKKEYVAYVDEEWDDLAQEKNFSDKIVKNIVIEVEQDKVGLEWLERREHPLAPMQRDEDPAPTVYVEVVTKFAKVNVGSAETSSVLRFSVDVAASLTNALANLPAINWSSKQEIVIVFLTIHKGRAYTCGLRMWYLSTLKF